MQYVTYVENVIDMKSACLKIAKDSRHPLNTLFTIDSNSNLRFNVNKVRVHYNGVETLCCVSGVSREAIESSGVISVIGHTDGDQYIFDSKELEAIYDRVRGDLNRVDDDGVKWKEPRFIGVIAE